MAGLYVHVPFCHSECTYCDFYRTSYRDDLAWRYLDALEVELSSLPKDFSPSTIFVGGGTPSALKVAQLSRLLSLLDRYSNESSEYTFEVNPRSATDDKIRLLAEARVSRVSFGVQSFDDRALTLLGRRHRQDDVARVFHVLREFVDEVSFDLIFGWPNEGVEEWHFDVQRAIELGPDHLSAYSLVYEEGTPLAAKVFRGELSPVGEELERRMFLDARAMLKDAGYEHYEVSNFARNGRYGQHNQGYWEQHDYFGVGPSACSTIGHRRMRNKADLDLYVRVVNETGVPPREEETLSEADKLNELLMLRLRTSVGLCVAEFETQAGEGLDKFSEGRVAELSTHGLLHQEDGYLKLTLEGLCVADSVIGSLFVSGTP